MEEEKKEENTFEEEAKKMAELAKRNAELEAQNADLQKAKAQYYDALLNGRQQEEEKAPRSAKEIREELFKNPTALSNREYAKLAVELDDACIREDGESCFLPKGKNITPSVDERDVANRMHSALEHCVSHSTNDAEFNRLWDSCIRK